MKHQGPRHDRILHQMGRTIALKRASGPAVANFIRDDIFCRFGIPKLILSDNVTPFINSYIRDLCEQYRVDHVKSVPYYPQEKWPD